MESVGVTPAFWSGRRVLVTGHTGFKGSWLCLWLRALGAEVHGFALPPPTDPSIHQLTRIADDLASNELADIRDFEVVRATVRRIRPEIVLHLAAQPLVRYSYAAPIETYAVNVMGTAHLLEAIRQIDCVRAIVVVTTDKCYDNREWPWGYREIEPMGGHDPYSSSKGCAELVCAAYRRSYAPDGFPPLATARAGNVIGGGDWAQDRLLPDLLRAVDAGSPLRVRAPDAIRPWQHTLEPLSGYLTLAERLHDSAAFAEPWNFGPDDADARPVRWIVEHLGKQLPSLRWQFDDGQHPHEANYLKLDSSKARSRLGWRPKWPLRKALDMTLAWHQAWRAGDDMRAVSRSQIDEHMRCVTTPDA